MLVDIEDGALARFERRRDKRMRQRGQPRGATAANLNVSLSEPCASPVSHPDVREVAVVVLEGEDEGGLGVVRGGVACGRGDGDR